MKNLFLFDALAYSYFLAYQIGDLPIGKRASIKNHSLTFLKNRPRGMAKAGLVVSPGKRVYGVLYQLPDEQFELFEKKVLPGFSSELVDVILVGGKLAHVMVPVAKGATPALPFRWYLDLMLAGLKQVKAPPAYQSIVNCQEHAEEDDFNVIQAMLAKSVLKNYHKLYKKSFVSAFELIEKLTSGRIYTIKSKRHPFNGRLIDVGKGDKGFTFETTTMIKKGQQDPRDLIVGNPDLTLSGRYYIKRHAYVVDHVSYGDRVKHISGTIQALADVSIKGEPYFWRLIVPVQKGAAIQKNFQWWKFMVNGKPHSNLLKLTVEDNEVHFYSIQRDKQHYAIIDSLAELPLKRFQEICYANMLVYALIKGRFYSGDGYFVAYADNELNDAKGLVYQQMNKGIDNLLGVFTTNPYTGIEQTKYRRNNKGHVSQKLIKERRKGLGLFCQNCFSNLVNLLLEKEKIRDSLTQIILNQQATLEIKIPILYVALESISGVFSTGGDKHLKPIKDNLVAGRLIELITKTTIDFAEAEGFNEDQKKELGPLVKRLASINSPPNADKLSKVFKMVGYDLKPWDSAAINERNAFLHGFTPKLKVSKDDLGFRAFYDLSLRLHFLLSVLLLKKAGYKGKVINYNKLHEHITKMERDEEVFIMI